MRSRYLPALAVSGMLLVGGCSMFGGDKSGSSSSTDTKTIDSQTTPITAVSSQAQQAFFQDHPGASPTELRQETKSDGSIVYVIKYKDTNGKEKIGYYGADGSRLSGL